MPIPEICRACPLACPEIRQAAASECALACLAMVASYYGQTKRSQHAAARIPGVAERRDAWRW